MAQWLRVRLVGTGLVTVQAISREANSGSSPALPARRKSAPACWPAADRRRATACGPRLAGLLVDIVMGVGRERRALPGLEIHHIVADRAAAQRQTGRVRFAQQRQVSAPSSPRSSARRSRPRRPRGDRRNVAVSRWRAGRANRRTGRRQLSAVQVAGITRSSQSPATSPITKEPGQSKWLMPLNKLKCADFPR